ncbi:MAG: NADH-quinone oxidoreductase subunit NuoH [Planctomycetota bacterium]|nr:MAG: NADH-quinone oxidoreductase subunit NuoH [Planctomycetota bacterium]
MKPLTIIASALPEAPVSEAAAPQGNGLTEMLAGWLPESVPFWGLTLMASGLAFGVIMAFVSVVAMFSTWLERKVAGHIQIRLGPMRVGGWHGWAQAIADGVKLLIKEDIILASADRPLFKLAPALVLGTAISTFVVLPFAPGVMIADVHLGIFFVIAISSVTTIGVIMAGWGSNNKWSVYGAMREAAQVASYEIPLGLSLMPPVIYYGSFSLLEATQAQSGWFGMHWYILDPSVMLVSVPSFVLFFVATLAETKRAPFDLPESESELVAGFHTEYSGIRFSFFFMEEYAAMFVMSAIATVLWFGGWNFLGLAALEGIPVLYTTACMLVFIVKSMLLVFVMMWVRWTLPRLRIDQVMILGYKYLTPLCLIVVFAASLLEYLRFVLSN